MRNTVTTWVALIIMGAVSVAAVHYSTDKKYAVKKMGSSWFVVNESNQKVPVRLKANDKVEWSAEGSDLVFQFPVEMSKFFTKEDGTAIGNIFVVKVAKGDKLKLKVKGQPMKGTFTYAVYVVAGNTFAEGSSPPIMIIE